MAAYSQVGQGEALLPEHLPGDDELLDLAGAFVDPEQPYVAVQPFDRHATDVPGAAVDLDRTVSDPADRLAGEILRRRRCEPPVGARLVLERGVEHQGAGREVLGLRVGEHGLDELVLADHVAALRAFPGVGDAFVDQPGRDAHAEGRDDQPPVRQAPHGRGVTGLNRLSHQCVGGHPDAGEGDVGGPGTRLAHLVVSGRDRHPFGVSGDDEHPDALAGRRLRVGAGEHDEHVGRRGVGDVALEAVDDPAALRRRRRRRQAAGVGARVWFGQRERRDHLAGGQPRQPLLALLVGPGQDEDLTGDPVVRAEQRPERRAGVAELDGHPHLLPDGQAQAAVLGREGVTVQAHLLGLRDQPGRDLVGFVDASFGGHHLAPDEVPQHIKQLIKLRRGHHEPQSRTAPSRCPVRAGVRRSGRNAGSITPLAPT